MRLLASTVEPGENFGRFNLPMSTRELVRQISNGSPCEVPRFWLNAAMQAIEQCFGNVDINVETDTKIAQLTPNRADLNDYGRRVLANPSSATLSEAANQALCWLMGEQASHMRCGEARAAILEGFGPKVDEELQAFFCSPNAGTQRPGSPDGSLATETRKPGSLK